MSLLLESELWSARHVRCNIRSKWNCEVQLITKHSHPPFARELKDLWRPPSAPPVPGGLVSVHIVFRFKTWCLSSSKDPHNYYGYTFIVIPFQIIVKWAPVQRVPSKTPQSGMEWQEWLGKRIPDVLKGWGGRTMLGILQRSASIEVGLDIHLGS